ncbi:proline-rich transmembrane protein 1-like [Melanotaenia boesemani]|uniref:proline-rich transmembrane protein 1-like n=1 Tax=Melanotaenia boesemani TaxID=1250792 RepID=UPI001C03B499|nr:proline-rich transmembrane protein 1-like [Melanotaenia boesemani]
MDYNKSGTSQMGWNRTYSTGQSTTPPSQNQQYQYPEPTQLPPAYSAQQPGFGAAPHYAGVRYEQQPQPYSMGQQYVGQPRIITVQPAMFRNPASPQVPVNDYLGYSIFTLLCCCLPLGICALVHSISTRDAIQRGDQVAAERYSSTARTLNHVALGIGLTVFTSSIIYVIVMFSVL